MIRHLLGKGGERGQGKKTSEWECNKFFEIKDTIGRGKYSTVYRVKRRSDGQLYSMKVTDMTPLSAKARQDVVNEIRLLSSLEHPNLLRYYEAFCDHHQLMLVTELMAGGDLGALIDKRAVTGELLSERQVWCYFIQIALGLRYLHHNRILHRDIKPQNILIGQEGGLKISDLGISKVLDAVFTRALIGTPYYLSPEQWLRRPYSYSADVWALGCVLHELCTLQPLFTGRTNEKVKAKVLSGVLGPLPSRYSFELWELLRLMLHRDPAARPTMDEILQMPVVRAHVRDLPVHLQPLLVSELEGSQHRRARLLKPVTVPCASSNWDLLNVYLPAARYPTGPAVVDALRMRHSRSCPHLAEEGGEGGGGDSSSSLVTSLYRHSSVVLESPRQDEKRPKAPTFGTFPLPAATAADLMAEGMGAYDGSWEAWLGRSKTASGLGGSGGMLRTSSAATAHALLRCNTLAVVDLTPRRGGGKAEAAGRRVSLGSRQPAIAALGPSAGDSPGSGDVVEGEERAVPGGELASEAVVPGSAVARAPANRAGEEGTGCKRPKSNDSSSKGGIGEPPDPARPGSGGLLSFWLCRCS